MCWHINKACDTVSYGIAIEKRGTHGLEGNMKRWMHDWSNLFSKVSYSWHKTTQKSLVNLVLISISTDGSKSRHDFLHLQLTAGWDKLPESWMQA